MARAPVQDLARNAGQHLKVVLPQICQLAAKVLRAAFTFTLALQHRPVQVVLTGKVAEDDGLVHPGPGSNLARRSPLEAAPPKKLQGDVEDLLPAAGGGVA